MKKALLLFAALLVAGCGEKSSSEVSVSPHLEYETEGDAVTITDCDTKASGALIIPATIEGKSVTSIEQGAFEDCFSLTSITIPEGVTSIGDLAFFFCSSLTAVTFLGDAPKAGERVFSSATPTIYRKPEAKGWGETFDGRPVKLISEEP